METIYERVEKVRQMFMRLMPRMNSRFLLPSMHDFTMSEIKVIHQFREPGKFKMSDVANQAGLPLPTATHVVDKLVKKGFLKRETDEKDRRVIYIEVTSKGRETIEEFGKVHRENMKSFLNRLEKEDQEKLVKAMEDFAKVMEEIGKKMERNTNERKV